MDELRAGGRHMRKSGCRLEIKRCQIDRVSRKVVLNVSNDLVIHRRSEILHPSRPVPSRLVFHLSKISREQGQFEGK